LKKQASICLVPHGDSLLALRLKPENGDFDYRVEYCELLDPRSLGARRQRELSRGGKRQLLLLGNADCTLLQARLPLLAERETRQALLGLAHKYKGAGEGGWIVDTHLRGEAPAAENGSERQDVSGLFVEQGAMARIQRLLAPQSIRPQKALPGALALEALLRRELHLGDPVTNGAWNLVHLGSEEIFLVVGDARGPLFFRELPRDLSEGADREEYVRRLSTEVERSNFFARQGEQSVQVKRVFISGDPELAEPLFEEMEAVEGLESSVWRPERRFALAGEPAGWALALPPAGAAILDDPLHFTLMQRRDSDRPAQRLRARAMLAGAAAALVLLPLLIGGAAVVGRAQERALAAQQGRNDQLGRSARAAARDYLLRRSLLERQALVERLSNSPLERGAVLRDLARRMPAGVRLRTLDIERNPHGDYLLKLHGECVAARSDQAQGQFLSLRRALADSPYLEDDGKPQQLKINETRRGELDSEVLFSLEYRLTDGRRG